MGNRDEGISKTKKDKKGRYAGKKRRQKDTSCKVTRSRESVLPMKKGEKKKKNRKGIHKE